jgi:uncharacterized protein YggT (Ycf19 family)
MPNNPSSNEQTTEVIPQLDALPTRESVPNTPAISESVARIERENEAAEAHKEDARLVKYAIGKINDVVQWLAMVVEISLLVRFLLKLAGATPSNMFASFLYAVTDVILIPFHGILPDIVFRPNQQAFEWATLIAMGMYGLLFYFFRRFLRIPISEPEGGVPK